MKTRKLFELLLLFTCLLFFANCSDENEPETEIHHLSFEKDYYERPLLEMGVQSIMIRGGNRDYTIEVEHPEVLEVTVDLSSPTDMGNLKITPKQKGETTVTVRDNIVQESIDLRIKITDGYLNLAVSGSTVSPYQPDDEFFLINNDDKSFYLYDDDLHLKHTGNYRFFVADNAPHLELTFQEELNKKNIYTYDLSTTSSGVLNVIKEVLGWDWREYIDSLPVRDVTPAIIYATDTENDMTYHWVVKANNMPENVLE